MFREKGNEEVDNERFTGIVHPACILDKKKEVFHAADLPSEPGIA